MVDLTNKAELYRYLYPIDCIQGAREYIENDAVDLMITDPPFGIAGDQVDKHYHRKENFVIRGYHEIDISEYPAFSLEWIREAERILRPGGSLYVFSGYSNLLDILNALRQTKLKEINHLIWKYNFGVYTTTKYVSSHYHILYYVKPGGKVTFNTHVRFGPDERDTKGRSLNYQDREDVWTINREYKPGRVKNKNELPAQLLTKLIQYSSYEGDLIADFFLGGFSTAKVAIGLNRAITGFEINSSAFNFHLRELKKIQPGHLLKQIKSGKGKYPTNKHKRWKEEEILSLFKRYQEINNHLGNKSRTIKVLQEEFGRGYFAILNKLEQIQKIRY